MKCNAVLQTCRYTVDGSPMAGAEKAKALGQYAEINPGIDSGYWPIAMSLSAPAIGLPSTVYRHVGDTLNHC